MEFELPSEPEVHMGGHGLYSTASDYMRFIRMWLNDGNGEHGCVLKSDTALMAEKNHLGAFRMAAVAAAPDARVATLGIALSKAPPNRADHRIDRLARSLILAPQCRRAKGAYLECEAQRRY